MKEATGELNMTVVTVVAIAAVAAFFYAFIWPGIRNQIQASTYCSMADCPGDDFTKCIYYDEENQPKEVNCKAYYEKQNAD